MSSFIHYLHEFKLFDFIIYADDTTISTTIEIVVRTTTNVSISDILNNELSMVNNWLKVNKLSLNRKKSKYIFINRLKRFLPIQPKVLIYNSLVLSHLNFVILLWGFKCDKVFKLEKKLLEF